MSKTYTYKEFLRKFLPRVWAKEYPEEYQEEQRKKTIGRIVKMAVQNKGDS